MRRITTKAKQKSKERFNQIIVGIVLVFLMLLSIIGYSLSGRSGQKESEGKIIYNGVEFIQKAGYWTLETESFQFIFSYNPKEVVQIDSELKYLDSYLNKPLYIQTDSNEAATEIYTNLKQIVQRIQPACLNDSDNECKGNLPFKDCSNNFIIIQESNLTNIYQNQSCVFISGPKEDLIKVTDEFLFKILGIEG